MREEKRGLKKQLSVLFLSAAVFLSAFGPSLPAQAGSREKESMADCSPEEIGEKETGQVNLLTGRLRLEHTDLPGGEESPLEFVRYYQSSDSRYDKKGNLSGTGNFWTHNYFYYAEISSGNITIYLPGGARQRWYKAYLQDWKNVEASPCILEEQEEGLLLTGPDGEKVLFDSSGLAVSITWPDGRAAELSYEEGRLVKAASEDGYLDFEYSEDCLGSVTDSAGNRILYSHDEDENLISAFVEDGWSLQYFYDDSVTDGERLVSVTNEEGREILSAEYELISDMSVSYGQSVVYLETETQPACTFSYEHYNGIYSCTYADGSTLAVTFDQNTTQPEYYLWSWYDSQGAVMRRMQTSAQKY